jgi:hypothetical protein
MIPNYRGNPPFMEWGVSAGSIDEEWLDLLTIFNEFGGGAEANAGGAGVDPEAMKRELSYARSDANRTIISNNLASERKVGIKDHPHLSPSASISLYLVPYFSSILLSYHVMSLHHIIYH